MVCNCQSRQLKTDDALVPFQTKFKLECMKNDVIIYFKDLMQRKSEEKDFDFAIQCEKKELVPTPSGVGSNSIES